MQVNALGVEYGKNSIHSNIVFTSRTINDDAGVYITDNALHFDVAFTF